MRRTNGADLSGPISTVPLDRGSGEPLQQQLYARLREAVLRGRLPASARLPTTRALSEQLGVSRNVVVNTYEQLVAEGYLEAVQGSGTFVARALPEDLLTSRGSRTTPSTPVPTPRLLSRRGELLASAPTMPRLDWRLPRPFYPGIPAYEHLPLQAWRRIANQLWRDPSPDLLGYGSPLGHGPLRVAIAAHLNAVRGVHCDPEQVVVTSGSQQALDLAARVLLDPGDEVLVEDPCYPGARNALLGAGAHLVPVRVDQDGMDVAPAVARAPRARLAYVTPSHQYPLGATMSVARRLQLLRWARDSSAWIVEDDYDSEFRYTGRPLPALQGLDQEGRVVYVGTFSKVLFPSLRLGYMVVPPDLLDGFLAARAITDRHPPTLDQAVLGRFIADGHFMRHVRRMRVEYAARQDALLEAAARTIPSDLLELVPDEAGMHLLGRLPDELLDLDVAQRCAELGVSAPPLSYYQDARSRPRHNALLLGYTGFDPAGIRTGVQRLAAALQTLA